MSAGQLGTAGRRWQQQELIAGLVLLLARAGPLGEATAGQEIAKPSELYLSPAISSIALQPDGRIVVANPGHPDRGLLIIADARKGVFAWLGGGIFRFNADGSLDRSFSSQLPGVAPIEAVRGGMFQARMALDARILIQPDGCFLTQGGKGGIVRLRPDGRLDESFCLQMQAVPTNAPSLRANMDAFYPFATDSKGVIAVLDWGDYKLEPPLVSFGGYIPWPAAHRFDPSGRFLGCCQRDEIKAVTAALNVNGLCLFAPCFKWRPNGGPESADEIIFLGRLTTPQSEQFQSPEATAAVKALFNEIPAELCRYAARLPDGGLVVAVIEPGGGRLVRFSKDWQADPNFTCHLEVFNPRRMSIVADRRGGLFLAGSITRLNGEPFSGVARLEPNGATDRNFRARVTGWADGAVEALAVQPNGQLVIGGMFSQVNDMECENLARLNPDGSVDQSFQQHFEYNRFLRSWQRLKESRIAASTRATSRGPVPGAETNATAAAEAARVNSASAAAPVWITKLDFLELHARIQVRGNPNRTYILQTKDSFEDATWANVVTNTTDANGEGLFLDKETAGAPVRFYRVLLGP